MRRVSKALPVQLALRAHKAFRAKLAPKETRATPAMLVLLALH